MDKRSFSIMDRRGILKRDGRKDKNRPTVNSWKKKFKKEVITTRTAIESKIAVNQLTPVTKILEKVSEEHHETIILQEIDKKEDALQYTLNGKCYRLFLVLFGKIDARRYLNTHDMLQSAIESKDDKHLDAVLLAYERSDVRITLAALPDKTKQILFEGSWNKDVIERLFPHTTSYFIPRGQAKSKMFALVCYTTSDRNGAKEEAGYITKGLKDCGFTIRGPLIDWTFDQLTQYICDHIEEIKEICSVFFLCLMSHGDNGILYDRDGKAVKINNLLKTLDILKPHIPAVVLIQACQGEKEPAMQVGINYRYQSKSGSGGQMSIVPIADVQHISVMRANTMVVTSAAAFHSAARIYFFKYFAQQLEQSDGITTVSSMVQLCSKAMSLHSDPDIRRQVPAEYTLLTQPLILPRAAAFDRKQIQEHGHQSGSSMNLIGLAQNVRELLQAKLKDTVYVAYDRIKKATSKSVHDATTPKQRNPIQNQPVFYWPSKLIQKQVTVVTNHRTDTIQKEKREPASLPAELFERSQTSQYPGVYLKPMQSLATGAKHFPTEMRKQERDDPKVENGGHLPIEKPDDQKNSNIPPQPKPEQSPKNGLHQLTNQVQGFAIQLQQQSQKVEGLSVQLEQQREETRQMKDQMNYHATQSRLKSEAIQRFEEEVTEKKERINTLTVEKDNLETKLERQISYNVEQDAKIKELATQNRQQTDEMECITKQLKKEKYERQEREKYFQSQKVQQQGCVLQNQRDLQFLSQRTTHLEASIKALNCRLQQLDEVCRRQEQQIIWLTRGHNDHDNKIQRQHRESMSRTCDPAISHLDNAVSNTRRSQNMLTERVNLLGRLYEEGASSSGSANGKTLSDDEVYPYPINATDNSQ